MASLQGEEMEVPAWLNEAPAMTMLMVRRWMKTCYRWRWIVRMIECL